MRLIDWEGAGIGEAAWDLAGANLMVRSVAPGWHPIAWARLLDSYRAAGGPADPPGTALLCVRTLVAAYQQAVGAFAVGSTPDADGMVTLLLGQVHTLVERFRAEAAHVPPEDAAAIGAAHAAWLGIDPDGRDADALYGRWWAARATSSCRTNPRHPAARRSPSGRPCGNPGVGGRLPGGGARRGGHRRRVHTRGHASRPFPGRPLVTDPAGVTSRVSDDVVAVDRSGDTSPTAGGGRGEEAGT
ncbi:hypothetical protein G7085_00880 [Tessaracoccus sp. HDW20]|uniref:hypothetical protein n=1 Tax=Tessaracoccus coleopterorum TaxID=2714950 RepID=UPI0018D2EB8A|nr:hypothetical protein [Tessaracoccus coleopterorum]NHB83743.1 hypothetical protein [Tessaracoccus coleopterorum]